jgi:hypothetical protein
MRIELLVVPDCPHAEWAGGVLTQALDDIGLGAVGYSRVVIDSSAEAQQRHFVGSPTFAVDGEDVFPAPDRAAALACRIYGSGRGVPDLPDLRQALKRAAAQSVSR